MMSGSYVMGIDGGGSTVRVVIAASDLTIHGQSSGPTANPSVVGRDAAAETIRAAMRGALRSADLSPEQIYAVGIGIAGAAAGHSEAWLRQVVTAVIPQARLALSADYETALVGALGQCCGVLVLAGTGSLAYGVNAKGESAMAGAWGYLIGDEGSGYWLGSEGLRAAARALDGRGPMTALTITLLSALSLGDRTDLTHWLYDDPGNRTREIAELAPLVLKQAVSDTVAAAIVQRAADELVQAAEAVIRRLAIESPEFAFAGGLLSEPNPLTDTLCRALRLPAMPVPRYPPVIGAALLALRIAQWPG
jgi:N-acetylglucosamine kinase-like BadF-type ATPase